MSNANNDSILLKCFTNKKRIQTIDKLLDVCDCSLRTSRRKIKTNRLICSYNKNSIFYTVPSLPKFNEYGIWHCGEASFSKWGNLSETIVQLVDRSEKGLSSRELNLLLNLRAYDSLRVLFQKSRIKKIEIQSQNIYCSAKSGIAQKQIEQRKLFCKSELHKLPEADIIIAILLEIIYDKATIIPQKICERLKKRKIQIKPIDVEKVTEYYELKKKLSTKSA